MMLLELKNHRFKFIASVFASLFFSIIICPQAVLAEDIKLIEDVSALGKSYSRMYPARNTVDGRLNTYWIGRANEEKVITFHFSRTEPLGDIYLDWYNSYFTPSSFTIEIFRDSSLQKSILVTENHSVIESDLVPATKVVLRIPSSVGFAILREATFEDASMLGEPIRSYHNTALPADVNVDGKVTAEDAYIVQELLNAGTKLQDVDDFLPDVNDDLVLSPVDLLIIISQLPPSWQNPGLALDVNNDGYVSPLDSLILAWKLGGESVIELPYEKPDSEYFYDVNGDFKVTVEDWDLVVNCLNDALCSRH